MASNLRNAAPSHLIYAPVHNATDPSIPPFLTACATNSIATALQLASTHEAGTVTFGLNRAVQAGHFALAGQLRALGAQWDAFTVTHAGMTFAGVKWLVEGGYDVNTSLIGGGGLLGIVVSRNDSGCIHYLLERGARPELGPPLLAHGPLQALRAEPNSYWTLNRAAAVCSVEIFAALLAHGADLNRAIPLHYAAGRGPSGAPNGFPSGSRIPMLEYLVGLGVDVNGLDDRVRIVGYGCSYDGTPLAYAVKWVCVEEAKWLLDHGADAEKKSVRGFSARDQAKMLPRDHELAVLLRNA